VRSVAVVVHRLPSRLPSEFIFVLVGGAVVLVLVCGVIKIFLDEVLNGDADEGSRLGPREIWRNNRTVGFMIGLVVGLAVGLIVWLKFGFVYGFKEAGAIYGLKVGSVYGLMVGFVVALTRPAIWPTTLAWLNYGVPATCQPSASWPFSRMLEIETSSVPSEVSTSSDTRRCRTNWPARPRRTPRSRGCHGPDSGLTSHLGYQEIGEFLRCASVELVVAVTGDQR
jgi:hypothetical protein